uniref:cln5-like protein 1 n=1 Tax=Styela clava TaxID=7725 RepID=UPI00193A0F89|nr:cln5-like protein 1 [Styela clava]
MKFDSYNTELVIDVVYGIYRRYSRYVAYSSPRRDWNFQFSGAALCPGSSGGGGGGLSGGSIFLIIFFVVLFIYFIGGIIFRKITTDAAGSELIPNKEFWSSLPGLIKDGVMFLVYKCKGESGRDYDNI